MTWPPSWKSSSVKYLRTLLCPACGRNKDGRWKTVKIVAIIQARMGSTRLPGKVLMDLCGQPILYHIIERIRQSKYVSRILVATSTNREDDAIEKFIKSIHVDCFRGDSNNVLSRYFHAAEAANIKSGDWVVRLTADNPLVDPNVLDNLLDYFKQCGYAYASTSGFPVGLGAEVFTFEALKEAYKNATEPFELEHVTPYMYRETRKFGKLSAPKDYSQFRFTVDTPEDYEFAKQIYSQLYRGVHDFYLNDIISLLKDKPEILLINSYIHQKGVQE